MGADGSDAIACLFSTKRTKTSDGPSLLVENPLPRGQSGYLMAINRGFSPPSGQTRPGSKYAARWPNKHHELYGLMAGSISDGNQYPQSSMNSPDSPIYIIYIYTGT